MRFYTIPLACLKMSVQVMLRSGDCCRLHTKNGVLFSLLESAASRCQPSSGLSELDCFNTDRYSC